MRKSFIIILLLLQYRVSYGQDELLFSESVVLKTDQHFYVSGDRISYHVFVLPGEVEPGTKYYTSNFVHIDFVDPEGEIIEHQKLKLNQGAGKGDILTSINLKQGYYRIFAYTASMSQLSNEKIFYTEVPIYVTHDIPELITKSSEESMRFFYEGGRLISGYSNKVVFNFNSSIEYSEDFQLIDQNQNLIKKIAYNGGLGSFEFTPEEGNSYFLINSSQSFPLDAMVDSGFILKVKNLESNIQIDILKGKSVTEPDELKAIYEGKIVYTATINPLKDNTFLLKKTDLPNGVIQFALSGNGTLLSEKLIYNKALEPEVQISLEQSSFSKNERAGVSVNIRDVNGEALESILTVMVKKEYGEEFDNGLNAIDLAKIKAETVSEVSEDILLDKINIDDYLITCKYDYSDTPIGIIEFRQKIELAIDPESPGLTDKLSFIAAYFLEDELYSEIRYEAGRAILNLPDLENTNHVWFAGFDTFGLQIGEIIASNPNKNVELRKYASLNKSLSIKNNEVIKYINQKVKSEAIKDVYGVPAIQEIFDEIDNPEMYITPDDYLDESDLREFIVGVIPKTTVRKKRGAEYIIMAPSHTSSRFRSPPLYFINDVPTYDATKILGLKLESIDHFEVYNSFNSMASYGIAGRNGIFKVFLKGDELNPIADRVDDMMTVDGLTFSKFNSNGFTKPEGMKYPDFRTLLYLSQPLKSDVSGRVVFSFDTSDISGNYIIEISGISSNGDFFSSKSKFSVDPQSSRINPNK